MQICEVEGCDRPVKAKSLCPMHYQRARNGVAADAPVRVHAVAHSCSIDGCGRPVDSAGLCQVHWKRQAKGTPLDVPVGELPNQNLGRRRTGYTVDPVTMCWLYDGFLSVEGYAYGHFRRSDGTVTYTTRHRVAYMEAYGEDSIPEGWQVDHVEARGCAYRHCIRPDHLEAVTPEENARRGKGSKTHCDHGHLFDDENTIHRPNGHRGCRECGRIAQREYQARKKAEVA